MNNSIEDYKIGDMYNAYYVVVEVNTAIGQLRIAPINLSTRKPRITDNHWVIPETNTWSTIPR